MVFWMGASAFPGKGTDGGVGRHQSDQVISLKAFYQSLQTNKQQNNAWLSRCIITQ